jgi:putative transferase (TIGR04331 family)
VGILHYSGVQAARFVNSLKGDPSAWWNSSEVQEARQAFVARYANFSENWLEAWMNEFERILAE